MELALPRPHPLIKEARERQHRRRIRLALAAVAIVALVAATSGIGHSLGDVRPAVPLATAALPDPCALLANADVAKVFGANVAYRSPDPALHSCSWSGWPFARQFGKQTVTLDVARATRADFERLSTFVVLDEAPGTRRIAQSLRVRGVGQAAFAQSFAGVDLEVWYHGLVISVRTTFVGAPLAAEKQLAAAAIGRIDRPQARAGYGESAVAGHRPDVRTGLAPKRSGELGAAERVVVAMANPPAP
jgi:hypothetical protein